MITDIPPSAAPISARTARFTKVATTWTSRRSLNKRRLVVNWQAGTPMTTATGHTIADGIAVRQPVPAAVDWMRGHVDDFELVSEERIARAQRAAQDSLGLVLEPAGAVAIAAALQRPPIAVIISGSNISTRQVASLARGATRPSGELASPDTLPRL